MESRTPTTVPFNLGLFYKGLRVVDGYGNCIEDIHVFPNGGMAAQVKGTIMIYNEDGHHQGENFYNNLHIVVEERTKYMVMVEVETEDQANFYTGTIPNSISKKITVYE